MDHGNICLLGLLDLSAAFDTVDHEVLLKRLEITFGIEAAALASLKSYLSERSQVTCINGFYSSSSSSRLLSRVPQGLILGPLLFLLYTAPVVDIIRRHVLFSHCYADDTQLYFYCSPDQMDSLLSSFSNCICEIEHWMASNRLKLNCDKTQFIWIASHNRYRLLHDSVPAVNIGSSSVSPVTGTRNLGVYFLIVI